jgi:hypothetical protein
MKSNAFLKFISMRKSWRKNSINKHNRVQTGSQKPAKREAGTPMTKNTVAIKINQPWAKLSATLIGIIF